MSSKGSPYRRLLVNELIGIGYLLPTMPISVPVLLSSKRAATVVVCQPSGRSYVANQVVMRLGRWKCTDH